MRTRITWTSSPASCDQYHEFADYNELVKYCFSLPDGERIILHNRQRHDQREDYDADVEIYDDYRES